MTLHVFTTQEKLLVVERMIRDMKSTRAEHDDDDHRQMEIMKSVAADLRGRLDAAPSVALRELERRLVAVKRSLRPFGYDEGPLIAAARELVGRWPVVKQALEMFGSAADGAANEHG